MTCQTHHVCRRRSHGHIGQGHSPVYITAAQQRDNPITHLPARDLQTPVDNDWWGHGLPKMIDKGMTLSKMIDGAQNI